MQGTHPSPAPRAPQRSAAPLPPELRARLTSALATTAAERIAADALVSVGTVRRARDGAKVQPIVRAALARVLDGNPPPAASVAA